MRLKKLIIHGFKSFADRTVLEFDEGITAIVGPNGCGKSNICDAFRWVLGEQSAKSMRGQKMGDVVFAGTSTRKPMSFAEVTLVFTDVGDSLPIEFDEVAVTRRLHRSGESQYLLNRNPVRLKDVQSLFLDSGIGKHSFAFFEQGKIDQIINLGPLERRSIFEKAAGILRFLQRKEEALRKLSGVDTNVNRVNDIHEEVARQLQILEQQAEAARKFKENRDELQHLEVAVAVAKWMALVALSENLGENDTGFKEQLDQAQQLQLTLSCQLRDAKEALAEGEFTVKEQAEIVYEKRSAKALKAKERESSQERLKEAEDRKKRLARDLKELEQQQIQGKKAHAKNTKELETVRGKLEKAEEGFKASQETLREVEEELTVRREAQQEAQQSRMDLVKEESRIHAEQQEKSFRLENAEEKLQTLHGERDMVTRRMEGLQEQIDEKQALWEESSSQVDGLKKRIVQLNQELENLKAQIDTQELEQEKMLRERAEVIAREKALRSLQEEHEGVSKGVKKLLQASAKGDGPIGGKVQALYELLEAQDGAGKLLAGAMHPYQDTLVVKTEQDFQAVVDYAQKNGIKDFSILCQENLQKTGKSQSGLEPLLDKVVSNALTDHLLQGTYCAKDMNEAWALYREKEQLELVSQDGSRVDHRGVAFFIGQGEGNVFVREAELKALGTRLKKVEKRCIELEEQREGLATRRQTAEDKHRNTDRELRTGEMRLVEVNFALQQLREQAGEGQQKLTAFKEEEAQLKHATRELSAALKEIEGQYKKAQQQAQQNQGNVERLGTELERWEAKLKDKRQLFGEAQLYHQDWKQREQDLAHQVQLFELQEREAARQEERIQTELEQIEAIEERMSTQGGDADRDIETIAAGLQTAEERLKRLEEQVQSRKERIVHVEENQSKLAKQIHEWEEKQHKVGVKAAQVQSNMENIVRDLRERHDLDVQNINPDDYVLEQELDTAEKRVRKLRKAVEDAGDVNMAAIDECEQHRNRCEFLTKQLGDLNESKDELLEIIARMDEESRKIFSEVFGQIRENFRKNFQILFRGGEADLKFLDDEDILKAGIDIVARPPGKQMRSIQLLSGGEKCLTAVALLFAIFEVKHAPFCLLDEIDAPLDDSNIERFVSIVKQFVDRSQFVIITHNKRTMAIADRIFGVTMETPGASKILSISFQHEEEKLDEVLVEQVT